MSETPIEDLLDDLLRQTRADPRTTRRLLDEASDHLRATAAELQSNGMPRHEAEIEAVRRFGPLTPIAHAVLRRSLLILVVETLRAAIFLAGCGLVAVGISGLVAWVMNVSAGRSFVGGGGGGGTVFGRPGASVNEIADDAVVLRVIAGLVGLFLLLGYLAWRRRASEPSLLAAGLIDALGAAAFAAATAVLAVVSVSQPVQTGTPGVGFPLSGAVVALPATVYFCIRSARALLRSRTYSYESVGVADAG